MVEVQPDDEVLEWSVADPEAATVFDDGLQCLVTTLPKGGEIGWDTCGCGKSVITCGCVPITLPSYVLKMRDVEQRDLDRLAADLKLAESKRVSDTTDDVSGSQAASETVATETVKSTPRKKIKRPAATKA